VNNQVVHRLTVPRIKKKYQNFHQQLGKTGAGLWQEDVQPNSTISNLIGQSLHCGSVRASPNPSIDEFAKENPWYHVVHGWW
jgi:hypothetical protein